MKSWYLTVLAAIASSVATYALAAFSGALRRASESKTLREMRELLSQAQAQAEAARAEAETAWRARIDMERNVDQAYKDRGAALEAARKLTARVEELERRLSEIGQGSAPAGR